MLGRRTLGLIVNPIAGIGGRVGLKGSDGAEIQERALELGAVPRSLDRAALALERVRPLDDLEIVTFPGEMGEDVARACGFAPIVVGSLLSWVIVPFIKAEPPYDELYDKVYSIIDWWDDNAKPRERIGEVLEVEGMRPFLEAIGEPPRPQQVFAPRKDPFFFWKDEDFEK